MSLFPILDGDVTVAEIPTINNYPVFKEIAWDFVNNIPLIIEGSFKILEGQNALLTWIYKALKTERYLLMIYSFSYGNEINNLVGNQYSKEYITSEAGRYIEECLLINPYITGVSDITVRISGDVLAVSFTLSTVYGEVEINV